MTPFRIGHGYDVHALGPDLPLWLGGVRVAHTHGCIAHSDGDVLIHALCDALLGAAALGDIGTHFPDTSSEFRNIDSKILLKRTVALLSAQGYAVGNVDCTLCMQRPKIKPYIPAMRKALSPMLHATAFPFLSCTEGAKARSTAGDGRAHRRSLKEPGITHKKSGTLCTKASRLLRRGNGSPARISFYGRINTSRRPCRPCWRPRLRLRRPLPSCLPQARRW